MLWLKVVLAGAAVAFCVLLGYLAANKYRSRKAFYAQFYLFNERYLSELGYARRPLPQFLAAYPYTGDFQRTLAAFSAHGMSFPACLTQEEKKECEDYFGMLGRGDAHTQSGYFGARRAALAERKDKSKKEAEERGTLYLKLGLLAGLAFVILII